MELSLEAFSICSQMPFYYTLRETERVLVLYANVVSESSEKVNTRKEHDWNCQR